MRDAAGFETCFRFIHFKVGQPLGYYSSWPLFALTHHILVWFSAEQVYPGKRFTKYAILGDDVVIADERVGQVYRCNLGKLGVEISVSKSLISPNGSLEFAKRFIIDRATIDVSPFSLRKAALTLDLTGWYHVVTTLDKRLRYSTLLRLAGLGYRSASRNPYSRKNKNLSKRIWTLWVHSHAKRFGLYVTLSVIAREWLCPTVAGQIWFYLFERFAPQDLIIPPDSAFNRSTGLDECEYTIMREWMGQYLSYVKWYAELLQVQGTLDVYLDVPSYTRTWYTEPEKDLSYGTILRIYDLARDWSKHKRLKCLPIASIIDLEAIDSCE